MREPDDVLDQVDDRAPAGGGGRDRGDLRHPRDPRPDAPPTINLDNPAAETKINLCANAAQTGEINIVQSNSFGFGGTNACLIMGRV
jgi:hypothetical protein